MLVSIKRARKGAAISVSNRRPRLIIQINIRRQLDGLAGEIHRGNRVVVRVLCRAVHQRGQSRQLCGGADLKGVLARVVPAGVNCAVPRSRRIACRLEHRGIRLFGTVFPFCGVVGLRPLVQQCHQLALAHRVFRFGALAGFRDGLFCAGCIHIDALILAVHLAEVVAVLRRATADNTARCSAALGVDCAKVIAVRNSGSVAVTHNTPGNVERVILCTRNGAKIIAIVNCPGAVSDNTADIG